MGEITRQIVSYQRGKSSLFTTHDIWYLEIVWGETRDLPPADCGAASVPHAPEGAQQRNPLGPASAPVTRHGPDVLHHAAVIEAPVLQPLVWVVYLVLVEDGEVRHTPAPPGGQRVLQPRVQPLHGHWPLLASLGWLMGHSHHHKTLSTTRLHCVNTRHQLRAHRVCWHWEGQLGPGSRLLTLQTRDRLLGCTPGGSLEPH